MSGAGTPADRNNMRNGVVARINAEKGTYMYMGMLYPQEGYAFAPEVTITINGHTIKKESSEKGYLFFSYTFENPEFVLNYGDVNGDGKVDSTDARLILQYYAKKISADALDLTLADVDGSGTVDSTDARLILQYYAKKITGFPKG